MWTYTTGFNVADEDLTTHQTNTSWNWIRLATTYTEPWTTGCIFTYPKHPDDDLWRWST